MLLLGITDMTSKLILKRFSGGILDEQDRKELDKFVRILNALFFSRITSRLTNGFLPQDQVISDEYCLRVQGRLHKTIRQQRSDMW